MKKRFLSVLCLVCGVAFFSSCSNNDDDDNSQQEENQETTIVADTTGTHVQGTTVSGRIGNYTYVDLGLEDGTLWATYNVGASKPSEYGDYFAWGETAPKDEYTWGTYKWCEGSENTLTKYCFEEYVTYGTVDGLLSLLSEDDAATANWGAGWRMPTNIELDDMLMICDWEWTTDFNGSGVAGRIGTSTVNGNTIFLPAAGSISEKELSEVGDWCLYWCSDLFNHGSYRANAFQCTSQYQNIVDACDSRCYGYSVRAVVK